MDDKPDNNVNNENENKIEDSNNKKSFSLTNVVITAIVVALISIGGTYALTSSQADEGAQTDSSTQETTSQTNNASDTTTALDTAYTILKGGSIYDLEDNALTEGAINGMADAVEDPYTDYLDETEVSSLNDQVEGSFEGIGAEVMKEGEYVRIVSPIPGSPAEEAGLQPNDLVAAVDGESVAELSINEAVNLIRGEEGTEVTLTIVRGETETEVTITRGTIPLETVYSEVDSSDSTIGHITITNFATDTSVDLINAIEDLAAQGVEKYIFDLRGNPGGLLNSGLETANIFVPDGEDIMHIEEADGTVETFTAGEQFGLYEFTGEAVALINGGSASASEILGAAMNSSGIPLIGEASFGKGTVQSVIPLSTGGQLKYTSAKWLTGEGEWLNETGLVPNHQVSLPDYASLFYINTEETYQEGQSSDAVANINAILNALGYDVDETNEFNAKTTVAVQQFQSENFIAADGIVTGETATALIEALQELIANNDTQYEAAVNYLQGNLDLSTETEESTEETSEESSQDSSQETSESSESQE